MQPMIGSEVHLCRHGRQETRVMKDFDQYASLAGCASHIRGLKMLQVRSVWCVVASKYIIGCPMNNQGAHLTLCTYPSQFLVWNLFP